MGADYSTTMGVVSTIMRVPSRYYNKCGKHNNEGTLYSTTIGVVSGRMRLLSQCYKGRGKHNTEGTFTVQSTSPT